MRKFFAKLFGRPQAQQRVVETGLTPESQKLIDFISSPTVSGQVVNEASAMKVAAAWCCQRILSESIGMIPWSMYRKTGNHNAEQAEDHWLQPVLNGSPNSEQTKVEFKEDKVLGLTASGNAYSLIERFGKRVTSLTPIQGRVTPMRKKGGNTQLQLAEGTVFFRTEDRGLPVDLPREKVWHVKGFGRGLQGLSPLGAAREAIGGALAQEAFANTFFANGGMPAGTVTYPGWLKPDQRAGARENLQAILGGLNNAHKFVMFEGGVKPEPWQQMNLDDMQFILSRKFGVLEICRFYRVPPHMVAELEKGASYASIEQMSTEFVMYTLMPYLTRFEASVERWLLPPEERGKYFLRFNVDVLLRATSKERAEFLASMVNNGLMNRNEARAKENLNRVDDKNMDKYTVQTAMTTIDKIGEKPEPQPGRFPPRREEPAPQERNVMVQVSSPQEEQRSVLERIVALTDATQGLADSVARIAESNRRFVEQQHDSQHAVLEATTRIAGQVDENSMHLVRQTELLAEKLQESQGQIGDSIRQLAVSMEAYANQRRKVTIAGEEFVSEPVH